MYGVLSNNSTLEQSPESVVFVLRNATTIFSVVFLSAGSFAGLWVGTQEL